jgi:hypothetical protein
VPGPEPAAEEPGPVDGITVAAPAPVPRQRISSNLLAHIQPIILTACEALEPAQAQAVREAVHRFLRIQGVQKLIGKYYTANFAARKAKYVAACIGIGYRRIHGEVGWAELNESLDVVAG